MARVMKDSGIEWIGEIPNDWSVVPLQYHADLNTESLGEDTAPDYEFDYVEIGSVTLEGGINEYEHVRFADAPSRARRIVKENDIIVSTVRTYLKAIAIVPARKNVIVSTGFAVLSPKNINVDFLGFFLKSEYFVNMVTANSVGISYPAINASDLVKFKILLPSVAEQHRIADFLDRKCAEIDAVIEKTKATIEEYKKLKQSVITEAVTKGIRGNCPMKDSGIEWIGEIPQTWRVVRGKNLFIETNERSTTGEEELLTVSHITGITPRSQKNVNMFMSESLVDYKICRVNDIAANTMWMWQGAIGVSKHHGVISPSYNVYRQTADAYDPNFLDYLLRIRPLVDAYNAHSTGITASRLRLYPEQFLSFFFFVPSREEQQEIVEYLDRMCGETDTLIAKKTALLTELETYKKSLIYEYVTGKTECIEVQAQEQAPIVYPSFPAATNTDKPRFAQAVLMSKILDSNVKQMGRVKLEKILYTIENSIGFDFDTEYVREAAGPLHSSIYECEGIIGHRNKWFTMKQSQYGVSYTPTSTKDKYKKYYDKYFGNYDAEINRIISVFRDYTMDQAEIVATLFAAWNDAIIDQKQFTDEDIVDDVLNNWHDNKKRFAKEVWLRAMAQMKQNNIVPKGYGKRTVRRKECNA